MSKTVGDSIGFRMMSQNVNALFTVSKIELSLLRGRGGPRKGAGGGFFSGMG